MFANAGDMGSVPGSERSPGEGNGNSLQYTCLKNLMNRRAWWGPEGSQSRTRQSDRQARCPLCMDTEPCT